MRALLIRHGQTRGNALEEFIGSTDEPLSPEGREEAEKAPKDLSVKKVFVSPMLRAKETAAILFPNAEQTEIPGLREMDFGEYERRTQASLKDDPRFIVWNDSAGLEPPPGGESRGQVAARAVPAFAAVLDESGEDAVFVIHGCVIMVLLSELAEPKMDFFDYWTSNLGGFSAECVREDGRLVLKDVTRLP